MVEFGRERWVEVRKDGLSGWTPGRFLEGDSYSKDTDRDQLSDGDEVEILRTDPNKADTDGDLLADGIEWRGKTMGLDPLKPNPISADTDKDRLANIDELRYGTDPLNRDSDGDGSPDGAEVTSGSDPTDASDRGVPPPASELVELELTIGDDSSSHSERYNLSVGSILHQAPEFGIVSKAVYKFRRNRTYTITIEHQGSKLAKPDFDYVAFIRPVDPSDATAVRIVDAAGILGQHLESDVFFAAGKSATLVVGDPIASTAKLRFTDSSFSRTVEQAKLGDRIYLELSFPQGRSASASAPTSIEIFTEDPQFGTTRPVSFPLKESVPGSGKFRTTTSGILSTFDFEDPDPTKIVTVTGDRVHARYAGKEAILPILDVVPIADPSDEEEKELPFRLESVAGQFLEVNGGDKDSVKVLLTSVGGEPLSDAVIRWTIQPSNLTIESTTDEQGIAELVFELTKLGEYRIIGDGVPLQDRTIGIGKFTVQAEPAEEDLDGLVAGVPQVIGVQITRPTMIAFLNSERGGYIDHVLSDGTFQLEVREAVSSNPSAEITVKIGSSKDKIEATLYHQGNGLYLSNRRITAHESGRPMVYPEIAANNGTNITASYKSASTSIPFYNDWVQFELEGLKRALHFHDTLLKQAQTSEAAIRRRAIANALYFVEGSTVLNYHRLFIGWEYLDMLGGDNGLFLVDEEIPADSSRLPAASGDWAKVRFTSDEEAERVYNARLKASKYTLGQLKNVPSEIRTNAANFVRSIPDIIASPAYGLYTMASGQTLDGEQAGILDRVLGGADAGLFVLGMRTGIPRLARMARNVETGALRGLLPKIARSGEKSVDRLSRRRAVLEKTRKWKLDNEAGIAERVERKRGIESRIAEIRRKLAEESNVTKRAQLREDLRSATRNLKGTQNQIDKRVRANRRHKIAIEEAERRLEVLRRQELSAAELQRLAADGRLPDSKSHVNGRTAHWHYENQINRELAAENFVPGKKLAEALETGYRVPHTGVGDFDLAAKRRKPIRRPHPDHVNRYNLDIGDSKYYDFDHAYKDPPMREAAARTIADTVEKSTLYQRARATAELTKLLGRAPTADEILGAVSKSKIRIYTPTPVPRAVQSMIRKLVGRDALRLEFKVREAKFLDWPAY